MYLHVVSALLLRSHYIQISTRCIRYFVEPLTDCKLAVILKSRFYLEIYANRLVNYNNA